MSLPAHLTSFVGRERESRRVRDLLSSARLVTLTGPGGAGKTRLALDVARVVSESFDAAWFVDLAVVTDPSLAAAEFATSIGLRDSAGTRTLTAQRLTEHLRGRHTLVVLDNCEHVVAACAVLVESLLLECSGLHVLATSREPLGVQGEQTWRVPPLAVPPRDARHIDDYEAVRLFVDRVRLHDADFALDDSNSGHVAQLCRTLDGLPLAIELAAAAARSLALPDVVTRLDDRFGLLTGGTRTAVDRQRTLKAAVDWSYDLLDHQHRLLLSRLAVFAGSFTSEAAEDVCAGDGVEREDVLGLLTRLVDGSLVARDVSGRHRLLETIREYAWQRLAEQDAPPPLEGVCVLRRDADFWTISYAGRIAHLRHVRGFDHLHRLLSNPGRELHALDLTGAVAAPMGRAGEVLDSEARAAYKERLSQLQSELDEAREWGDDVRAANAQDEMDELARHLAGAVGLGGRARRVASASERARFAVTKAVKDAIARIAAESPVLGDYLKTSVRTGTYCSYTPPSRHPIAWDLP